MCPRGGNGKYIKSLPRSSMGGHFGGNRTTTKVLQSGFYWPTLFKDVHQFVSNCDKCQRMGSISKQDEPPLQPILEVELFDIWEMDFMGPFPSSSSNLYILLAVDYVSKWVEVIPTRTNDARVVESFLRNHIVTRFKTPRALIKVEGTHLCNKLVDNMLRKYGVYHRTAIAYHPQTNGQAEVSNKEIESILKKTVNSSKKDWAKR